MENVEHAHAVDTRPSLPLPPPPVRRPGDEANKDQISSPLSTALDETYACNMHGTYMHVDPNMLVT